MKKFLVIVESPTKARTINKYLGDNYIVKSSFGHIRDLSSNSSLKNKKNSSVMLKKEKMKSSQENLLIRRIGIDPYHNWIAQYEVLSGKEKIVHELEILAKNVDHVYLATDLDREGEAIAWHLQEVIQVDSKKVSRVIFNEITRNSIVHAFNKPTVLNLDKVNAQQARRFMDRLVGYMLSPLLWKKIARGLSAGRVQSVVVRLIVERERKIRNFIPKKYWELYVTLFNSSGMELIFKVFCNKMSGFLFITEDKVQRAKDILLFESTSYVIVSKIDKYVINKSPSPFITSTLQQASYIKFGYSIKKTMFLAQRLYELGYITYMRTNSIHVSKDALKTVRSYICDVYGQEYLSKNITQNVSKSTIQEAHEAIRPSDIYVFSELIENMNSDLKKLYQLIWCQFIASQMKHAKYLITTLLIQVRDFQLQAHNRSCCFDGWEKIMSLVNKNSNKDNVKDKDHIFKNCKIGDVLILKEVSSTQYFTKIPPRYNEASLVKELEKRGIGRPSTYVSIISTIQNRGYVYLYNNKFYATKIGEIVTDRLFENFYELMDYQFTANMEYLLDKIAVRQEKWKDILDDFFAKFRKKLDIAEQDFKDGGMRSNSLITTSIVCSLCGKNMGIRTAITGVFLSCEGYSNVSVLKDRCKNTINLIPNVVEGVNLNLCYLRCEKCDSIMDNYFIDNRRKLHICINSPLCHGYVVEHGVFFVKESNDVIQCEKCMNDMYLISGRFGKYILCSNVECKNTKKIISDDCTSFQKNVLIPLPELLCNKSNAYFVLRIGRAGIFLSANTYPRSKETRAPFVEELVRFRDRLPKELSYLADAPTCDNHGNKTLIRFNRRSKQQYVVSEKNNRLTDWKSFFIDGEWKTLKGE